MSLRALLARSGSDQALVTGPCLEGPFDETIVDGAVSSSAMLGAVGSASVNTLRLLRSGSNGIHPSCSPYRCQGASSLKTFLGKMGIR